MSVFDIKTEEKNEIIIKTMFAKLMCDTGNSTNK